MNGQSSVLLDAGSEHRIGRQRLAPFWLHAQGILIHALDVVGDWQERAAERHRLMTLDERALGDLALTRDSADAEASKPFWRL